MKLATLVVVFLLAALPSAQAFDKDGKPANPVEAAYRAAKPPMPRAPLKDGETAQARAEAWEAFAAKEAHEHATVTGLKGQGSGKPNCAECEGWAWLNAGTAWFHLSESLGGEEKVAAMKKAVECYGNATEAAGATDECKAAASRSRDNLSEALSKLEARAKK